MYSSGKITVNLNKYKDKSPAMFLKMFVKDKHFYRMFFPLLGIIALQQLAALSVNLVDNIMLGAYSELALSGATLVNQIQFILQQLASGIGMGIVVLASQYWGKGLKEPIKKIISLGLKFALCAGIIFWFFTFLFSHNILAIFTNDLSVIDEGVKYLKIMCWTYLIFSVSNSLMYSLQSVETALIGTIMSISTIIINIILNYCLIFGNFGFPKLGIAGAAIATLVSRSVELIIVTVYVLFIDKKLHLKIYDLIKFDFSYLKKYIKISSPLMLSAVMWGVAQAAQTAILGHMTAEAIAANSIATVVYQMFVVFGQACTNTSSVTIAKTIGEEKFECIKPYVKTLQFVFICIGILMSVALFVCKDFIIGFYNISPETKQLTSSFLTVLCITMTGTCYEYPTEAGIIAGGGNTKYPAICDNAFMWLFTIPSAAISAFVFGFSPLVTFCFLKADQILKCIPNSIICNRYKWLRVLTKTN